MTIFPFRFGVRKRNQGSSNFRPRLEFLEGRDCPAAPTITAFAVTPLSDHMVLLTGAILDESPGTATVNFSGVVNGYAPVNDSGAFSVTLEASDLGNIYAQALDNENLNSEQEQAALTNAKPVIMNFEAESQGAGNVYLFKGRVVDEHPSGLTVTLNGLPSLNNVQVTVGEDGWFYHIVTLGAGEEGTATAITIDWWNVESDVAYAVVR
jgi:hypothetical protein